MKTELVEVYSEDANLAVIRPQGRKFPGSVIQGDTLENLASCVKVIAEHLRERRSDTELLETVEDLQGRLLDRVLHYQAVLEQHRIPVPFTRRWTSADYIVLTRGS